MTDISSSSTKQVGAGSKCPTLHWRSDCVTLGIPSKGQCLRRACREDNVSSEWSRCKQRLQGNQTPSRPREYVDSCNKSRCIIATRPTKADPSPFYCRLNGATGRRVCD